DPFCRLVAGAGTIWLVGQAVINMGYVTGLLPVTGIPLPLISAGGTSLVVTLLALGMLASFARHEPAAAAHLAARGPSRLARWPPRPAATPCPAAPGHPAPRGPAARHHPPARQPAGPAPPRAAARDYRSGTHPAPGPDRAGSAAARDRHGRETPAEMSTP